jgi:mRNA-degrading endonuclease RelE of RelBE toxin-antitoxin system
MPGERRFRIVYDREVIGQLAAIDARHYSLIRRTIEEQLTMQPDVETRNRKALRPPSAFGTAWELRFGPDNRFRVFYTVDRADARVDVLAIGEKSGSVLRIGGEAFEL